MKMKNCRGYATIDVILFTGIMLFLIFPLFSFTLEKYVYQNSIQIIKDTLDMTAIATYESLDANSTAKDNIQFDRTELINIYKKYLAQNLKLNDDLVPEDGSIAKDTVRIEQLELFTSGFPDICPEGAEINKLSIHVLVVIPLKPNLYREVLLDALGKDYVELKLHHDTELPVNN